MRKRAVEPLTNQASDHFREPRFLFWDVETSHNILAAFRLWERGGMYVPHHNIIQERYTICGAWAWGTKGKIQAVSTLDDPKRFARNPHDDYHVVKTLHGLLNECDCVVHHNGKAFDLKWVETRALYHGLKPLPLLQQIDTNLLAKSRFNFNSNSLDYLARFLKLTPKIHTEPGLWMRVLTGSDTERRKAIADMVRYNKGDVHTLREVFGKLQPFVPDHLNRQLFGDIGCPRCGSTDFEARGLRRSITRTYQRYQCNKCGGWFRDVKAARPAARQRVL